MTQSACDRRTYSKDVIELKLRNKFTENESENETTSRNVINSNSIELLRIQNDMFDLKLDTEHSQNIEDRFI